MTILNRYVVRAILLYFFLVLSLVMGIFVAVDYLGTMDEFIASKISLWRALFFVLLKLPFVTTQLIPVALLLAILVVFGLMSKHNEIIILKSSGISVYFLLKPVLGVGVGFSFLMVLLAEIVVPMTMMKANAIKYGEIRKETLVSTREKNIWIKGDRRITHINYFDPAAKSINGVTINFFNRRFQLIRRIDAVAGKALSRGWELRDVMEQRRDNPADPFRIVFHERLIEHLDFQSSDLEKVVKKSEEMNFQELLAYVHKVEKEGYDATKYRVDLYAKTAFPFVCLIMCLIGTGLTARGKLEKGLPVSISYGIGVAFLYWISYSFCLSLGYGEILPPVVAAWITNVILVCLGLLSLLSAE